MEKFLKHKPVTKSLISNLVLPAHLLLVRTARKMVSLGPLEYIFVQRAVANPGPRIRRVRDCAPADKRWGKR